MVNSPDPLLSAPPAFGKEEARQILREIFGMDAQLSALAGERDQNFRVDTPGGERFLFKISNPADGAPTVDMQDAALRHIERVDPGLPVMRALASTQGKPWADVAGPDGRSYPVRLFTFLPGQATTATALTPGAIWHFGQVTARLGRALRGFFHPAADYEILWDITHAAKLRPLLTHLPNGRRMAQVEQVLDRFEARVAPVLPALRGQVIHGDMSLNNVLFDQRLQVSGIVDFGDMTHAPLVCDLAVAIADALHGREDAIAVADAMIRGYVSATPLEDAEAEILADLVAARLATDVTVSAWRSELYPDNSAYSTSGELEAGAFLDSIDAVGIDAVARRFREACRGLPYRRAATPDLLQRRQRALPRSPLFYEHPVHLVRGEGVWLFDADDRRYLDCYNNVPVAGHSHPRVAHAVAQQQRLLATHSRYLHEAIIELAERLKASLPPALDAVFIVNSGSEANDLAWRIARAATGRSGALVTTHAYHGLTEATHALSPEEWATDERPAHVGTVPSPDGYRGDYRREDDGWAERYAAHVDGAARALGDRGLAAMYVDPAFTAEGILAPPPSYLRDAAQRVRAQGGLFVADEVQAGHGRSGHHLWSFQAADIDPDMVVMGKPMGNGFPVAALVVRSDVLSAVPEETELFSTFGGNPVACAAALSVLDVIEEEGLVQNAAAVGSYLTRGLRILGERHPLVGDVRGEGLLIGVELVTEQKTRSPAAPQARAASEAMRERGILISVTGSAGNVLKIRPPLVFQREHADLLLQSLDEVLSLDAATSPAGRRS
ncbi:MAG TPA: aminotransferase class III-fold pyridoxal phosphate-dependent enzyme [Streptosporangiaceae bacterium]|nr:aminotransferase class III-fold pyridoxal phosphate-dependent enzyme [Streptosporangiaceae bacterium]